MQPTYLPAGYMTARETAALLGISLSGIRDHVARGHLARAGGTPRRPYYASRDVLALANRLDRGECFAHVLAMAQAASA